MTSKSFRTLHVYDTILYADSVEWCPIYPHKNSFVCGTYQLDDSKKTDPTVREEQNFHRNGTITLFTVTKDKLEVGESIKCPAVLDMKWCPQKLHTRVTFAVANAEGEVCLFYLEEKLLKFMSKCVLKKSVDDFLALSLDWIRTDCPNVLCVSDSKGGVTLITVSNDSLTVLTEWKAHTLEAWAVCFDSFHSNILYSGGDEGQLKVWDWKSQDPIKIASSSKHTAGVTAFSSDPSREFSLVSGSYDEKVLFWDTRSWKAPLGSIKASGGLWRLRKDLREESNFLLAACIYGGFEIYDVVSFSTVAQYKEHQSLAYGADWCSLDRREVKDLLKCYESALTATCSFYDHKLCVSLWDENTLQ